MKSRDWKEIAELIGIAAIVASLIFVGLQMKQAQEIGNADRRLSQVANGIELHNAINEYADIWVQGNAGDELTKSEAVIFENLVLTKSRYHQHQSNAAQSLGSEVGWQSHIADMALFLYSNPGAREVWDSHVKRWLKISPLLRPSADLGSDYSADVLSALRKLDQARF